jgi:hypothetical protein
VEAKSNLRELLENGNDLGKTCQQTTTRKSGSGFRLKIFSPLGASL